MMDVRVLVSGTREWDIVPKAFVYKTLDKMKLAMDERGNSLTIIQGGANGIDSYALEWAKKRGVNYETYHAHWMTPDGRFDRTAGPKRNSLMATKNITIGFIFKGNRGTRDMEKKLKSKGIPTQRFGWKVGE